jgi:hypothetical protein
MDENHFVSGNFHNIVCLQCPICFPQGMTNNTRFAFSAHDTMYATNRIEHDNLIGDTK